MSSKMEHNLFRFKHDVVSLPAALNKTTTRTSRHHQAYLTWGTSPPHTHRHGEQHHHHMRHQTYLKHEQHHHLHHNNHTAFEFWRPDLSFYHILVPIGYRATALSDASVCLSVTLLPPETRGYVLWGVGRGLVNKHAFFLLLGLRVGRAGGRRPTVVGCVRSVLSSSGIQWRPVIMGRVVGPRHAK